MATQNLPPTSIVLIGGASGNVGQIDESPDSPDNAEVFLNTNGDGLRASFNTPTANLTSGAGLQTFRAWVRGTASAQRQITCSVYESGSLVQSLGAQNAPNNTEGMMTWTWDASILADISGVNAECHIVRGPSSTADAWIDALEWIADYTPPGQPYVKRLGGIPGMALNRGVW